METEHAAGVRVSRRRVGHDFQLFEEIRSQAARPDPAHSLANLVRELSRRKPGEVKRSG